ncbi:pentapeptide repeat-containing protein [Mesorhizobium plurifarium]|uniref:pentapeptide repeat-containing protein n=1 Tax=Sinorhizobium arboris TaxID=76745 RepID=UPI000425EEFA|nr:pentapeptide repeat-containing protein [Sinorhizobium arboris]PST22004.1 pentapeptide repeat-containing protein [Mesorhizobium plurifarium]
MKKLGMIESSSSGAAFFAVAIMVWALAPGIAAAADCKSSAGPGIDWRDCNKKQIMLRGSDLPGSNLFNTDFTMTDLRGANLVSANLEKATLVRASLAGARADKANFSRVEAYRGNFSSVSAESASFASAELQRTDFTGARLTGADFEKAELGRANFDKAVLTGARFSMANLSRAKLSGAVFEGQIDLDRAFLFLTRIEGLDLTRASGLTQDQVDLTCGDGATRLPSGLTAPAKWPCPPDDD